MILLKIIAFGTFLGVLFMLIIGFLRGSREIYEQRKKAEEKEKKD